MSEKIWCIECKKELSGGDNLTSLFGITSGNSPYCNNPNCSRYGLATVLLLKENTEAPKDAKLNKPKPN